MEHGQEQRRSGDEVAGVHVAAVHVGRDRRQRPCRRRHADHATERRDGDPDAGPELHPVGPGLEARHLVERIREVVGQEAEARDRRGPAPVGGLELEQVDLERVARLRAVDRDGPGDLVDAVEVQRGEVRAGDSAFSWPKDASRQSSSTIPPDPIVATASMAGSQTRWFWSRETWSATFEPPIAPFYEPASGLIPR